MNNKFKYMTNEYPELPTTPPQTWQNDFDYSRWRPTAKVHLLNTPWDTSEVKVDQQVIVGQTDVVKFENDEKRDEWFNAQDELVFEIMTRKFRQSYIELPIPFDVAITYNYIWVEYDIATSGNEKIEYETEDGIRKYFYFVRDISDEHAAPNCTRFILLPDYWTTYINHIDFKSCFLERGHYPVSKISADEYLENPIEKTRYLLTEDVENGSLLKIDNVANVILNENMICLVAFAFGAAGKNWSGKHEIFTDDYDYKWNLPEYILNLEDGVPNYQILAFEPEQLAGFLQMCFDRFINAKECIKAVYYIDKRFITLGAKVDLDLYTAHRVTGAKNVMLSGVKLNKEQFNYPDEYSQLAKLYTSPYSLIEISDFANGKTFTVGTQGVTSKLDVEILTSIVFNSVEQTARIIGAGNSGNGITLKFAPSNESELKSYVEQGRANTLSFKFDIPCFSVQMSAYYNNLAHVRWDNAFNRDHQDYIRDKKGLQGWTAYQNLVTNMNTQTANTTRTNAQRAAVNTVNNTKLENDKEADMIYSRQVENINNDYTSASAVVNNGVAVQDMQLTSDAGLTQDRWSLNILGAVGDHRVQAKYLTDQQQLTCYSNSASATLTVTTTSGVAAASRDNVREKTNDAITANDKINGAEGLINKWNTAINANNVNANYTTAHRANKINYGTEDSSTKSDWQNGLVGADYLQGMKQIEYNEKSPSASPMLNFGQNDNAAKYMTTPNGLKFSILTMGDGDIARVGDEFLRFGYTLGQYINIDDFNVMQKFSYWKCSFIKANYSIPDAYVDRIKLLLMTGVTIWRNPDDILRTSIYDNK